MLTLQEYKNDKWILKTDIKENEDILCSFINSIDQTDFVFIIGNDYEMVSQHLINLNLRYKDTGTKILFSFYRHNINDIWEEKFFEEGFPNNLNFGVCYKIYMHLVNNNKPKWATALTDVFTLIYFPKIVFLLIEDPFWTTEHDLDMKRMVVNFCSNVSRCFSKQYALFSLECTKEEDNYKNKVQDETSRTIVNIIEK